jgi:uncharacterized protein (TIGR00369 family)
VVVVGPGDVVLAAGAVVGGAGEVLTTVADDVASSSLPRHDAASKAMATTAVRRVRTLPLQPTGSRRGRILGNTGAMDLAELVSMMPFGDLLGIELTAAAPDEVAGRLAWRAELCTVGGALHGGVLMSLADSVGALCAFLNLPEGTTTSTIESKTNFFRGAREGTILATARPLHVGRTTIVVQTDLVDDRGKRVTQSTQTQAVISG